MYHFYYVLILTHKKKVGYEKKYIKKRFGDINAFVQNGINRYLINIINALKKKTSIWKLDWEYIFKQWILYEADTRKQCYDDKKYLTSISEQISTESKAEQDAIPRYQQFSKNPLDDMNNSLTARERILQLRQSRLNQRKLQQHQDEDIAQKPKRIDLRERKNERGKALSRQRDEALQKRRHDRLNKDENDDNIMRYKHLKHEEMKQRQREKRESIRIDFTCERDVFRSSVGDSCYIIPLMYWINIFGKDVIINRLRILQFELMVKKMDEYVSELLCFWNSYTCGIPLNDIQTRRIYHNYKRGMNRRERKRRKWEGDNGATKNAATFRYQDNKQFPEFIVDKNVLNEFNDLWNPCNERLVELLTKEMPDLMLLHDFDIYEWDYSISLFKRFWS